MFAKNVIHKRLDDILQRVALSDFCKMLICANAKISRNISTHNRFQLKSGCFSCVDWLNPTPLEAPLRRKVHLVALTKLLIFFFFFFDFEGKRGNVLLVMKKKCISETEISHAFFFL